MWLLISEIYPTKIRGKAMSLATLTVWGTNWVVTATFLSLIRAAGPAITFWIYACLCVAAFIFCYVFVPETKGRTLEAIEHHWRHFGHRPEDHINSILGIKSDNIPSPAVSGAALGVSLTFVEIAFSFRGRISRATFWLAFLCLLVAQIVFLLTLSAVSDSLDLAGIALVFIVWYPLIAWVSLAVQVEALARSRRNRMGGSH